jgi:hypothetical protein
LLHQVLLQAIIVEAAKLCVFGRGYADCLALQVVERQLRLVLGGMADYLEVRAASVLCQFDKDLSWLIHGTVTSVQTWVKHVRWGKHTHNVMTTDTSILITARALRLKYYSNAA